MSKHTQNTDILDESDIDALIDDIEIDEADIAKLTAELELLDEENESTDLTNIEIAEADLSGLIMELEEAETEADLSDLIMEFEEAETDDNQIDEALDELIAELTESDDDEDDDDEDEDDDEVDEDDKDVDGDGDVDDSDKYLANRKKVRDAAIKKQKEKKESADVDPINALIESDQTLTDEFKANAALIFETELSSRVDNIEAALEESYETRLVEAVEDISDKLTQQIDRYLDHVVTEWVASNQPIVEANIRQEISTNFMESIHAAFTENYIDVPASKVDLVEQLEAELAEVKESNENNAELLKAKSTILENVSREKIIGDAVVGITSMQGAKLEQLAAKVAYVNESDYIAKINTLKEFYFKAADSSINEDFEDDDIAEYDVTIEESEVGHQLDEDIDEPTEPVDARMASYLAAISRNK